MSGQSEDVARDGKLVRQFLRKFPVLLRAIRDDGDAVTGASHFTVQGQLPSQDSLAFPLMERNARGEEKSQVHPWWSAGVGFGAQAIQEAGDGV
jgi:hypothetical protein